MGCVELPGWRCIAVACQSVRVLLLLVMGTSSHLPENVTAISVKLFCCCSYKPVLKIKKKENGKIMNVKEYHAVYG